LFNKQDTASLLDLSHFDKSTYIYCFSY